MSNTYGRKEPGGFYGPDGEFYPEGSQAAQYMREERTEEYDREELYPKRPEIKYTTSPYPGKEPPAEKDDGLPDGYTGPSMYCKYCGGRIPARAVVCVHCGCQVGTAPEPAPRRVITNNIIHDRRMKNKWVAFLLCLFGGCLGLHKFYEGKFLLGIVYLCTLGLLGIGWVIDLIRLFFKPNPYSP